MKKFRRRVILGYVFTIIIEALIAIAIFLMGFISSNEIAKTIILAAILGLAQMVVTLLMMTSTKTRNRKEPVSDAAEVIEMDSSDTSDN